MKDYSKKIRRYKNIAFSIYFLYAAYLGIMVGYGLENPTVFYYLLILIPTHLCFFLFSYILNKVYENMLATFVDDIDELKKDADYIEQLFKNADANDSDIFKENVLLKKERIDLLQTIEKLERKNISLN